MRTAQTAAARPSELDEITLARAKRGDADACRALVERYQSGVFAVLGRMLGPRGLGSQVEDTAQDTFLRVFRGLHGFDGSGPAKLSTWILCVATRVALNELGRKRARNRDIPEDLPMVGPSIDAAERHELRGRICRAVADLSPEQQAAFVLREYHGLAEIEIAEALGIDVGAVKSRLFRARARLRQALSEVHHG